MDINELRRKLRSADPIDHIGIRANVKSTLAELMDRLEAAESETASWKGLATQFGQEADALRAKIAEMEKQEPVAHVWRCDNGHIHGSSERFLPMGTKLYTIPGERGE